MDKLLIISGPTASGKTDLALKLAYRLNGELVSADSRQVYVGMDIVTGKDIPTGFSKEQSGLRWNNRDISYYSDSKTRIWLTDLVYPNESFNVSFWNTCATTVISDIHARGKLPIVVGVSGLYIKSLLQKLDTIHVPPLPDLRKHLEQKSPKHLLSYLTKLDSLKAASLNSSDRSNPRRLLRAIEIASQQTLTGSGPFKTYSNFFHLSLTCDHSWLYPRIDKRVLSRILAGAEAEVRELSKMYGWNPPAMNTSGYKYWQEYFANSISLDSLISRWQFAEHRDARHQLTWFAHQPHITLIDPTTSDPTVLVSDWYNKVK